MSLNMIYVGVRFYLVVCLVCVYMNAYCVIVACLWFHWFFLVNGCELCRTGVMLLWVSSVLFGLYFFLPTAYLMLLVLTCALVSGFSILSFLG